jgi:Tfp pilus assembly protein PilF
MTMSILTKMFGGKGATEKTAPEPRGVDLSGALSMQLHGEQGPALEAYQKLALERPDDYLARFLAATIRAEQGEVAEAAESLRALSRDIAANEDTISRLIMMEVVSVATNAMMPAIAQIIVSFAEALKEKGLLQEAAVCLEIAVGLAPDNAHILHKFGDLLHDLRMYDYAEEVLKDALKRAPNHWGALYTYAVLLQDLKRDEEALEYYQKAVTFNPDHVNCRNNYGAALLRTNRLEEALAQCSVAEELAPDSPFVKVNLGNIYLLMQQYEAARDRFAEAVSLHAGLPAAYFGLARAEELLQGDPARIRELYQKALRLEPQLAEIHPNLKSLLD